MEFTVDRRVHHFPADHKWEAFEFGKDFRLESDVLLAKARFWTRSLMSEAEWKKLVPTENKQTLMRMIARVRKPVKWSELYMGGLWRTPLQGLPPSGILTIGEWIAKSRSRNFGIHIDRSKRNRHVGDTFVAVPMMPMVDVLRIEPLNGRDISYMWSYDLSKPFQENWSGNLSSQEVQNLARWRKPEQDAQPLGKVPKGAVQQQDLRRSWKDYTRSSWPDLWIHPNTLIVWEVTDSALRLPSFNVVWKHKIGQIPVDLKKYTSEVPFACFMVPSIGAKRSKMCPHGIYYDNLVDCPTCFVPHSRQQYLFSVYIRPKAAAS